MYYKKIAITDRLPEVGKFVTTIDEANEHRVYRLTEFGWNMRDVDGTNSPNNNLPIRYWLEEIDLSKMEEKAEAWDKLANFNGEEIGTFYWTKSEFEEYLKRKDWSDSIKNTHRAHFKGIITFSEEEISY